MELHGSDLKLLARASNGPVYRGFFGWPCVDSTIGAMRIQHMVEYGYLEFVYDWERDKPGLRLTTLGASRLQQEINRRLTVVDYSRSDQSGKGLPGENIDIRV